MRKLISVGSYKLDESGEPSSTIITSNNWPAMIDKAGLRGQWLELALIPLDKLGGDWSLLEATRESLREHSAEARRLASRISELEVGIKEALLRESASWSGDARLAAWCALRSFGAAIGVPISKEEQSVANKAKRIREQAND